MNDLTWMNLAAHVASRTLPYRTFENPRVGAVIVKNDKVIATGYHEEFGKEHAEINAFNHLKDKSEILGATLYVTLEPCSTKGKVGSCAESIKKWGLKRVVIGSIDPNPTANGRGIEKLRSTDLIVDVLNTPDSKNSNPAFYHFFETHLPYVQLKLAMSQNGFVTAEHGQTTKLTDELADIDIHKERAARSAIIIGSETMLVDNPNLTVRNIDIKHKQPLRIVIDRRGRLQNSLFDFSNNWVIYTENKNFVKKHPYAKLFSGGLRGILLDLSKSHIQSVMVEGGPQLIQSFLEQNLWQEMLTYTTSQVLPVTGVEGINIDQIPDKNFRVGNAIKKIYINNQGVN